ncbi:hypothetical protein ACFO4O_06970 [Glaciecola siphonariae]|uniref:Lipoprotein n=1 Tax=Glaciecola siphonariae TaxID=521012 RepID=A0ABV9LUS1_9ALTE
MRLFIVMCFLSAFESYACSGEASVDFKPFVIEVAENQTLVELRIFFPISDKAQSPMYLDSLTLHLPNKLSVELNTFVDTSLQDYYQADLKIARDMFQKAHIIGSYGYNDINGKSLSLCSNWKSFSITELLASEIIDE